MEEARRGVIVPARPPGALRERETFPAGWPRNQRNIFFKEAVHFTYFYETLNKNFYLQVDNWTSSGMDGATHPSPNNLTQNCFCLKEMQ